MYSKVESNLSSFCVSRALSASFPELTTPAPSTLTTGIDYVSQDGTLEQGVMEYESWYTPSAPCCAGYSVYMDEASVLRRTAIS